ncbi:GntR family transcriptional regulator [Amycolatopsis taiwanensis]|uniref:GntR family transcriptional regulator n=1 Tax=Amycolatopsis taiwanensis TaxID=342230 RepID=A0A9W6VGB8_9PSEU|nr:GntR family transcriptional regulator [Amycolatopsis taiwanensis]GLY65331.1 GntR family transcriptional regulator [Amycolatopsis taiwanensis]
MHGESLPRLTPASRRHQVAEALRDAITGGQLQPGDRLREPDLADRFGTSRAPLREALRQLENEGLVASSPYRGTVVLGISQTEVQEILLPIRLTLERFAVRHALPNLTGEDFAELEKLTQRMRESDDDFDELAQADVRFHEVLVERAGQPHCAQIWRMIQPRIWAYFRRDATAHPSATVVADQHARLLTALRSGDERKVLTALDQHINDMPGRAQQ